ncbi:hypothetical protein PGTUg99_031535 [Puccinia graminis f. sp. tritici]|uniref:Uncharacterized protein n=1 Tax=Puccinia graminis f. sp. tritici TaxID=56615 RepID=A0A5B0Q8C2_PUCGR|nr:hypothetical protein PGTUg99_031535 [Puccinia graminis f. sp. tritici]
MMKNRTGLATSGSRSRRSSRIVPLGGGSVVLADPPPQRNGFGFCEKWRTATYTAQLSIVIAVINLFATFLILIGKNTAGRSVLFALLIPHFCIWCVCVAVFQSLAWILILNVFNQDDRFYFGSRLSTSIYISIITSAHDLIVLTAIVATGFTGIFVPASSSSSSGVDRRDEYEPIQ